MVSIRVHMAWLVWLAVLVGGVALPTVASGQDLRTFRDNALGVQFAVPAGWKIAPQKILDETNAEVRRALGAKAPVYAAALAPKKPDGCYALIQVIPRQGEVSFEQIEADLGLKMRRELDEVRVTAGGWIKDMNVGEATLDRARARIIFRTDITRPDGERVLGVSVGQLTANGLMLLHCYAPAAMFEKQLPTFEGFSNALVVDPGATFVPAKKGIDVNSIFFKASVGAGLGLVAAIAVKISKKK